MQLQGHVFLRAFILLQVQVHVVARHVPSQPQLHPRQKRDTVCPRRTPRPTSEYPQVFLTINPLASTAPTGQIEHRRIELNWYDGQGQPGDWVGLFAHDPTEQPVDPLRRVTVADHPDGHYVTDVQFPWPVMEALQFRRQCLNGFWIGYVRSGRTISVNCLKAQPTWMADMASVLAPFPLRQLMIPGSHDAGSYKRYEGIQSQTVMTRWVMTQEDSVLEQLMYGIRHFDLRVGYYGGTPEKFWINHGIVKVHPLADVIDDVYRFVETTQEIVVLDFHQFPVGFASSPQGETRHAELKKYLVDRLDKYMLPASVGSDVPLQHIWSSGKRLIVAYSYTDPDPGASNLFWPGMPQMWANTMEADTLKTFMQEKMANDWERIWAAMLEFTPSPLDVILSPSDLRVLADQVDQNVTRWCRDLWWNEANVVAVDFILSTNIVDVAIEANQWRKSCLQNGY